MTCYICNKPLPNIYVQCKRCDTKYHVNCWVDAPSNRCYNCHSRLGKEYFDSSNNRICCCICYEPVSENPIICYKCKSIYHPKCWFIANRNKCCYCNSYINRFHTSITVIASIIVAAIVFAICYVFRKWMSLGTLIIVAKSTISAIMDSFKK